MSFYWQFSIAILVAAWLASPPQSIGDLARREKIRRAPRARSTASRRAP
jgi:hypothetical protein